MRFFISGTPKPQARPRFARRGKFVSTYSVKNEWKEVCKKAFKEAAKTIEQYDMAITVNLDFYFQRPKSHYRTGKNSEVLKSFAPKYHIVKPDKDNLEKAVTDAMTDSGLIKDDCIIIGGETFKSYAEIGDEPGCMIEIKIV